MKKRVLSFMTVFAMVFGLFVFVPIEKVDAAGNIEAAVQWAINKANDNSCGYSQSDRWGPSYYDCSSFVISALKAGGFDVGSATYTQNMRSNLTTRGFTWIPWSQIGGSGNLKRGDILLNDSSDTSKQHTEFYIGNNQNVGAHTSKRAWNDQVSVSGYYNHPWTGVLRCNANSPSTQTDNPLNMGDSFCAYIINTKAWLPLSAESNNNVILKDCPNCANQVWKFTRQSDNSYEIINCKTGLALDAGGNTALGENLYTNNDCDNNCQRWYIYGAGGAYKIKSKYKNHVIDIAGGVLSNGTNAQMYEYNGTDAQIFSIWKLDAWSKLGRISDVGTDFYAYIINKGSQKYLNNESDNNVVIRTSNATANQIWKFTRQGDGSYEIINCKTSLALDSGGGTKIGESLYANKDCDNDCQRWYLFESSGTYYLKSKYKDQVIDIVSGSTSDGANAQLYEYNGTDAQKFSLTKLTKPNLPAATPKAEEYSDSKGNNVKITWNACENATGYDIRIYDGKAEKVLYSYWNIQGTSYITRLPIGSYQVGICSLNSKFNFWTGEKSRFSFTVKNCNHVYGTWSVTKAATCTAKGQQTRKCSLCNKTETQEIPATGHHYQETVIVPTYSEQGYTLHKCTGCGDSYKDKITPKKSGYDPSKKPVISEIKNLQELLTKIKKPVANEDLVDMFDANGDGKVNVIDMLILKKRALK